MDLTFYVDGLGNCLVTPQELAETTKLPLDMVSKQLQILEARGLISRPAPMTINLNFRGA
jgi:DNA-binding MarR family transcriptional regulator